MTLPSTLMAAGAALLVTVGGARPATPSAAERACVLEPGPDYYAIALVPTGNVPGTRRAKGEAQVAFPSSPFGVAVSPEGSYVYDLAVDFDKLTSPRPGTFTVWATTPDLDQVHRIGALDADHSVRGRVDWNKFLVVVTLEASDDPEQAMWEGPIVARGLSRSGLMHTMAGHGPFEQENCASFGFGG